MDTPGSFSYRQWDYNELHLETRNGPIVVTEYKGGRREQWRNKATELGNFLAILATPHCLSENPINNSENLWLEWLMNSRVIISLKLSSNFRIPDFQIATSIWKPSGRWNRSQSVLALELAGTRNRGEVCMVTENKQNNMKLNNLNYEAQFSVFGLQIPLLREINIISIRWGMLSEADCIWKPK